MKIIKTIEISKKEERALDNIYEKFRESSLGDYYDFGDAITEMIDYNENHIEDFLVISYSDLETTKDIFKEFSDFMLYDGIYWELIK